VSSSDIDALSPTDPGTTVLPPVPEHRPTERTFHGDTVMDPYEWLRDKGDPQVIAHLEAENAYAASLTEPLRPLRDRLVSEFVGHTQETDLSVPVRRFGSERLPARPPGR
jgi:oligopeptidase B